LDAEKPRNRFALAQAPVSVCLFRLLPGEDLRAGLVALAAEVAPSGAFVSTCVGSLERASLRLAGAASHEVFEGPLEICSLSGTLSADGPHLHLCASDRTGKTIGGHLLPGSPIHTTAEVAITIPTGITLRRAPDSDTGYGELVLDKHKS